jgi:serine/threonine-protein kinase
MKLGQYELLERIAVGGMAEIYRGRAVGEEGFEKPVAIKRILPHYARDARFVQMLVQEARIHAQLSHRNIVQIHDLGVSEEGEYFIVLEYVDGRDLGALLEVLSKAAPPGNRMGDALALYVAIELGEGIHCAHELVGPDGQPTGLVHRDISPSNVLLSYAGEVKLSDFGLAKRRTDHSVVGSIKGKLTYMSPEQARRQPLDRRSDIFALGAVLFEMLTGRRLREVSDEVDGWRVVASGLIPAPRLIRRDLPDVLDRLLAQSLAPDPRDRFADTVSFIAAAREALTQVPRAKAGEAAELQLLLRSWVPPGSPRPKTQPSRVIRLVSEVLPGKGSPDGAQTRRRDSGPPDPPRSRKASRPRGPTPPPPIPKEARHPAPGMPPDIGERTDRRASSPAPLAPWDPAPVGAAGSEPVLLGAGGSGPTNGHAPISGGLAAVLELAPPVASAFAARAAEAAAASERGVDPRGLPASAAGAFEAAQPTPPRGAPMVPSIAVPPAVRLEATPTLTVRARARRTGSMRFVLGVAVLLGAAVAAVHVAVMPLPVIAAWNKPARVSVDSLPAGARVSLDGHPLDGVTPLAIQLVRDRRTHALAFEIAGFHAEQRPLRLDRAVAPRVTAVLTADPAAIAARAAEVAATPAPPPAPEPAAARAPEAAAPEPAVAASDADDDPAADDKPARNKRGKKKPRAKHKRARR